MNWWSMRRILLTILLVGAAHPTRPTPAQTPTVTQIAAAQHILVLWSDGSVTAAGANRSGQLGRPKVTGRFLPAARVDLPGKVVQVAAGEEDGSYALLENGTVWAWGLGVANNLGVRLSGARDRHTPGQVPGLAGVARIVAFGASAMAIMRDGSVRGWGEMPDQLTGGTRVFPGVATPIVVAGLANVTDIAGGPSGGYALTRESTVYAWGGNLKGELGTGTATDEFRGPGLVPGLNEVVSIATAFRAVAAVTRDGRVWTWGSNEQGGLGHGTQADVREPGQPTPTPMAGITDAVEVKAGTFGRHFIVRRRNGALIGWGNSDWGQLGAGVSGDFQLKPTPIKLADVDAYWLGGNFSFARSKDGAVWFWGEQTAARGLLGTRGNQRVPARVPPATLLP